MCGIAGYVSVTPVTEADAIIRRMTGVIAHRGPDDCGIFAGQHVRLGHRRLSIVDLPAGRQPMANEDSTLQIVFNGEIFNHLELRPDLERAGHRFQTRCDTEAIIHAYEEFGPGCLGLLRGMFAFAIWDTRAQRLFCARDRLGKKPFYYFWNGQVFVFASEIKALLQHPAISAEFEAEALPEYLAFGYISDERTMFRNIRKLPPGHYLSLEVNVPADPLRTSQYWNVPKAAPRKDVSEREFIHATRSRLEESVQQRLMSDVPLGVFLSGGVDSSAIAAITAKLTGTRLKTFSVGYREARYSELGYAEQVAEAIGTDHHDVRIGFDDFFRTLPQLIWHEDEPIAWPSSIPLYFVSKLAAKDVKVVLTGEGSDELFGGYERYRWNILNSRAASIYSQLPGWLRNFVRYQLECFPLLKADLRRKLRHTFLGRENTLESLYLENFYSAFSADEQAQFHPAGQRTGFDNYLRYFQERPDESMLSRMLYADQKTYLVALLMKQDRMSMAASIESRVPFLDHTLVEFASTIPDGLKIKGGEQKYVLKRAVEDLLPREIVYRTKMGFPTPIRQWLLDPRAKPLMDGLLNRSGFLVSFLEQKPLEGMIARHLSGVEDATDRVWRLLNLQLWGDIFITGRGSLHPSDTSNTYCIPI
jgi:asparagine synthase (glutamine-hydrolysing)